MAQIVRKQAYVKPRQDAALKWLALIRGISEAALVRQAIDQETGSPAWVGQQMQTILSEESNTGSVLEGVRLVNPFAHESLGCLVASLKLR